MKQPVIAITSGDPAGIGPEICLKLLKHQQLQQQCQLLILGDQSVFQRYMQADELPFAQVLPADEPLTHSQLGTGATLLNFEHLTDQMWEPGTVSAVTGRAAWQYIMRAIELTQSGVTAAVVTAPIHKVALNQAGIEHPGHTEIFAQETAVEKICMMLTSEIITCSFVTAHVGICDVPGLLSVEKIINTIQLSHEAMQKLRGSVPRLIVPGLNPHAGEGGLFGKGEEELFISPAIKHCQEQGIQVTGPIPPDTAFLPTVRAETDCYVCMYHDQGLIPLKALAFDQAVNVTLGLPLVRTSVDHGTALDIAGKGIADEQSLLQAIQLALQLSA